MRRFLLSLLLVLVGIGLVVFFFRTPIAKRVMQRALVQAQSADPFAGREDGLHVVLCGAGGPLPDPVRSGPCVAVLAGQKLYLVDVGSGASRRLARLGLPPGRVGGIFLTHFHSDHIDGLGELGINRWVGGGHPTRLPIYGPEGVTEIVDGLNQAYRLDSAYRTAHHGPSVAPASGAGFRARSFPEPSDGEGTIVLEADGLRVTMFRVEHPPVSPAVGYRFDYAGRSVVVSGDTSKSANLERFAKDVDLLVHEALSPELMGIVGAGATEAGLERIAKIAVDVLDYHATPVEAAESAEAVGAGHLLYYHVVPPMPIPGLAPAFLEGVADAYSGPVTLGDDGTAISLPAGSDRIEVQ